MPAEISSDGSFEKNYSIVRSLFAASFGRFKNDFCQTDSSAMKSDHKFGSRALCKPFSS